MPNIGAVLKDEIERLCRKECRRQVEPLRKAAAGHRRDIAALKRNVVALERQNAVRTRRAAKVAAPQAEHDGRPMRFVAKGLASLRARLGLSAEDLGRLLSVSGQSVYNWEKGKASPRKEQLIALASLRSVGKREAQARLEAGK